MISFLFAVGLLMVFLMPMAEVLGLGERAQDIGAKAAYFGICWIAASSVVGVVVVLASTRYKHRRFPVWYAPLLCLSAALFGAMAIFFALP